MTLITVSLFHLDFRANCGEKMEEFLKRCFYHSGQYDSQEHFTELDKKLKEHEVLMCLPLATASFISVLLQISKTRR